MSVKDLFLGRLGRRHKHAALSSKHPATLDGPEPTGFEKSLPLRSLLTSRVLISTLVYSMISLIDIAYRGIMPLFFSTSISFGGLGFPPSTIGACLSIYGVFNGFVQVLCFAGITKRFGGKRVLMGSLSMAFPVFALFPIMSMWTKHYGYVTPAVWAMILLQTFFSIMYNMAFGTPTIILMSNTPSCASTASIFIYIAAAAPNRQSIGATNGIAQMAVSMMRTFGPSFANSMYSLSMEHGYMGGWLVWWALLFISAIALACSTLVPNQVWKRPGEE